jgi:ABC-2 type transport system permease protein
MSIISLIIKREFIAKVRNKSFIVMTFLSPLLFVGIAAFVGYLGSLKADVKQIAIHDETGIFVNEFKNSEEFHYLNMSNVDMKVLQDSLVSESFEGLLFIPKAGDYNLLQDKIQYLSNDSPSITFLADTEDIIAKKLTKLNFEKAQLDTLAIQKAQADINIKVAKSTGEESLKGLNEIKIAIGGAFGYLIMMFIIIYGNMVMRSVIEEKTNRIIEIIISSVKPFQLMMGKIIGTSLAGILQFVIWAIIGLALMFGSSYFLGINLLQALKYRLR